MRWVDVCGPPGVGKSTLCDAAWPPREIPWDGLPYPAEWGEFLNTVDRLLDAVRGHPTEAACRSMTQRSFRKMATVHRIDSDRVYVQTGFAQRGLGIGWRLRKVDMVADFYRLMPVSLGVVLLKADVAEVQRRNVERGKDRSYMVPLMEPSRKIAVEVLKDRGVPVAEIDTEQPVEDCMDQLAEFVRTVGHRGQAEPVPASV